MAYQKLCCVEMFRPAKKSEKLHKGLLNCMSHLLVLQHHLPPFRPNVLRIKNFTRNRYIIHKTQTMICWWNNAAIVNSIIILVTVILQYQFISFLSLKSFFFLNRSLRNLKRLWQRRRARTSTRPTSAASSRPSTASEARRRSRTLRTWRRSSKTTKKTWRTSTRWDSTKLFLLFSKTQTDHLIDFQLESSKSFWY